MFRATLVVMLMTLWPLFQQQPAPKTAPTQEKSAPQNPSAYKAALDRLYRLIWPLGQSKVDLPSAVSAGTEKSAPVGGVARLYLVNVDTRMMREWSTAAGASQPVVCPGEKALFYRRGKGLFKETIRLTKRDVSSVVPPMKVADVAIARVYACTQDQKGGFALWAENETGTVRVLRVSEDSVAWEDLPRDSAFASIGPDVLAEGLERIRSIRPDGFVAWIQNHQLLGRKGANGEPSLLVDSDLSFSGSPNWIGDTEFLFVMANTPE